MYNVDTMGDSAEVTPLATLTFHRSPVVAMVYSHVLNTVVSADSVGVLEYWKADDFKFPAGAVSFTMKASA